MKLQVALTLVLAPLGASSAQSSFELLGPGWAIDVSPDGQYVAGTEFYWSEAGGTVLLEGGGFKWTYLFGYTAVSADGSVLVGTLDGIPEAAIWSEGAGWTGLGGLETCGDEISAAYDVSDDGSVVVGYLWTTVPEVDPTLTECSSWPFRWTQATGFQLLPKDLKYPLATCVSGDGNVVGGAERPTLTSAPARARIWKPGQVIWPTVTKDNPLGEGMVFGLSTDGTYAVGRNQYNGMIWSEANGMLATNDPHDYEFSSGLYYGVTDDGKTAVGTFDDSQVAGFKDRAVIWTESDGVRWLDEVLESKGVDLAADLELMRAHDITPDGRWIVGVTDTDGGLYGFRVYLDSCGYDAYGPAGTLELSGGGDVDLGGTFVATTANVAASSFVINALSLSDTELPFLGGTLLVDPGALAVVLNTPVVESVSSLPLPLPNDPALAYASLYFQSFALDLGGPAGLAFSNGLVLTMCP